MPLGPDIPLTQLCRGYYILLPPYRRTIDGIGFPRRGFQRCRGVKHTHRVCFSVAAGCCGRRRRDPPCGRLSFHASRRRRHEARCVWTFRSAPGIYGKGKRDVYDYIRKLVYEKACPARVTNCPPAISRAAATPEASEVLCCAWAKSNKTCLMAVPLWPNTSRLATSLSSIPSTLARETIFPITRKEKVGQDWTVIN